MLVKVLNTHTYKHSVQMYDENYTECKLYMSFYCINNSMTNQFVCMCIYLTLLCVGKEKDFFQVLYNIRKILILIFHIMIQEMIYFPGKITYIFFWKYILILFLT